MDFFKSDSFKKIANALFLFLIIFFVLFLFHVFKITKLLDIVEAKSFDLRQTIPFGAKKANPNFVVLEIDDDSLELLQQEFGRWPWKRELYADITKYLVNQGVDPLAYDLMFIGYQDGKKASDLKLAKTLSSYDNVYTSMNFDNRMINTILGKKQKPLPKELSLKVNSKTKDIRYLYFRNCRRIMNEIIESGAKIGFINVQRDSDGINRKVPLLVRYQNELYPYLSFKMALDYLSKKEGIDNKVLNINKKGELVLGKRKIKADKNAMVYLNWYDRHNSFKTVPFWKVVYSMKNQNEGKESFFNKDFFKDKIVFLGVSATALYDIKSVSISRVMPGVYFHPTLFNNILDNNVIEKSSFKLDVLLVVFLSLIVALIVHKSQSPIIASTASIIFATFYFGFSLFALKSYNLWIPLVYPLVFAILTFTAMYIVKYVNKARDFEYTYKLATTDGLTNLYNHRYFQDQLVANIENYQRYNNEFSIVLIDIDFFKKFNDTYGHQAGDAVLKQVAEKLKKFVRTTDIVARYGGEEMVIILTNTPVDEAYQAAKKVCNGIGSTPFKLSADLEVNVTISVGVATYPMHGKTPSELIEVADKGLYFAKENGRNQVGKVEGFEPAQKME